MKEDPKKEGNASGESIGSFFEIQKISREMFPDCREMTDVEYRAILKTSRRCLSNSPTKFPRTMSDEGSGAESEKPVTDTMRKLNLLGSERVAEHPDPDGGLQRMLSREVEEKTKRQNKNENGNIPETD